MNNRRGRRTEFDPRAGERPAAVIVELSDAGTTEPTAPPSRSRAVIGLGVLSMVALAALLGSALNDSSTRVPPAPPDRPEAESAAERYATDPTGENLRAVLAAIGGLDGVTLGVAEGSFSLVTFDPDDPARLIASERSAMGWLERGDDQEQWRVANGEVFQSPISFPGEEVAIWHNLDGTTTVAPRDYRDTPRPISILSRNGESIRAPAPVAAATIVVDNGAIFWVDEDDHAVFADNGQVPATTLALSGPVDWIEVHEPGRLVAYPADSTARTQVFDTRDFRALGTDHYANRSYRRVAVEADGKVALGVRFDGRLERFDWTTGAPKEPFGSVDIAPVPRALTVDPSGRIALTVDRSGLVSLWFVGDDEPLLQIEGSESTDSGRPGAAVAGDGTAVAVKRRAWPTAEAIWQIIDIDIESWLARARHLDDRSIQLATLDP